MQTWGRAGGEGPVGPMGAGAGQAKFFRGWISSRSASRGVSPPKENKLKSSPGGYLGLFSPGGWMVRPAPWEGSCGQDLGGIL